jgi:hypothetical protein
LTSKSVKTRLQEIPHLLNPKVTAPIKELGLGLGNSGQSDPRAGVAWQALAAKVNFSCFPTKVKWEERSGLIGILVVSLVTT